MSSNFINCGEALEVKLVSITVKPSTFDVGDPVIVGIRPAVAMTSGTSATTKGTFWFYGKYKIPVDTTSAIALGDILVLDTNKTGPYLTNATPNSTDKIRWGYALEAAASGNPAIDVLVGY